MVMVHAEADAKMEGRIPGLSVCETCAARAISFCSGIETVLLSRHQRDLHLRHRQSISCGGDAPATLFNVVSGFVKLTRTLADGRAQILGFRGPGEVFLMRERAVVELEAIGPARLCRFTWPQLERLLQDHPVAQAQFLKKTQEQLEISHDHMFLLGRKTAREKVASFLLRYGAVRTRRSGGRTTGRLRVTRLEMADFLGLTVETVSRVLARLAQEGILALGQAHSIQVMDPDRLRRTAGN